MGVEPVHRAGQLTSGWLGDHTSSIDWCEDNYAVSSYIAEFYNTLSNIPFILLGLHGVLTSIRLPHGSRFALLHGGIVLIGIGSFIFHSTLKWHAQVILDELPMIFASSQGLYIALADDSAGATKSGQARLKFLMTLIPVIISAIYLAYPEPVFHQLCYAAISLTTTVVVYRSYKAPQLTPAVVKQVKGLYWNGACIFIAGFLIWNIDNIYCDHLTSWRNALGSEYFGWISQGHAWWHLLTGLGGSRIATGQTYLKLSLQYPGEFEVAYSYGFLPYVRRVHKTLKSE